MRFSEAFQLGKTQSELDFADVELTTDNLLFVDPFAISQRLDPLSQTCDSTLRSFFQLIVDAIRAGRADDAQNLLSQLSEPNETRLGFSTDRPRGAGIGRAQALQLFAALRDSTAVQTGFLRSLEECELMIEGVGRDKVSDLTTNVIRGHLAAYTLDQCALHGVPVQQVALPPVFDPGSLRWESRYMDLPVVNDQPVLLVPKIFIRYQTAYEAGQYYRHYVLNFLQAEALNAGSSLVRMLKNGTRVVRKKDLEAAFPLTKKFLYEFSRAHPEVLAKYRQDLARLERQDRRSELDVADESFVADALTTALRSIPTGTDTATEYHRLMIGILEFLFFPRLTYPRGEQKIHQGRKRIDIVMDNSAETGVFSELVNVRKLPCATPFIECKNYGTDIGNPELDQLAGRFDPRTKFGMLCCRQFKNRELFVQRCRDTLKDDRGLILPLDDLTIIEMLDAVGTGRRIDVDAIVRRLVSEVWLG